MNFAMLDSTLLMHASLVHGPKHYLVFIMSSAPHLIRTMAAQHTRNYEPTRHERFCMLTAYRLWSS
jgi:hypothetical protein